LVPITLIVACSLSIRFMGILCSSSCSIAVSDSNVNMNAYFPSAVFMMSCTCSVVGIIGTGGSYLIFGLSYCILFVWQNRV